MSAARLKRDVRSAASSGPSLLASQLFTAAPRWLAFGPSFFPSASIALLYAFTSLMMLSA